MLTRGRVGQVPAPRTPVLIYDGSCGFCSKWISRAKTLDRRDVIRLLPLQDPRAPEMSGQPREALERAAHLIRPDGAVFAGAAAAREFFRYVPGGWVVRALFGIPGVMPVAERVYRGVARTWGPVRD